MEGTLEWAALTEADLPQLAELRTAIEYFDDPVERQDLAQLSESWSFPGGDPGFNCTVGRDKGGTIVAYGWNHVRGLEIGEPRVWLDGGVHPADLVDRVTLQPREIRALHWATPEQVREHCAPYVVTLLERLAATPAGSGTAYLVDGHPRA